MFYDTPKNTSNFSKKDRFHEQDIRKNDGPKGHKVPLKVLHILKQKVWLRTQNLVFDILLFRNNNIIIRLQLMNM